MVSCALSESVSTSMFYSSRIKENDNLGYGEFHCLREFIVKKQISLTVSEPPLAVNGTNPQSLSLLDVYIPKINGIIVKRMKFSYQKR